jgi:biopolymer transport protein ExbD
MSTLAQAMKEPVVIVSADAQTAHQSVINVLDAARRAGLARVTFAAQKSDGG